MLLFGGSDHCFYEIRQTNSTASLLACLPREVLQALEEEPPGSPLVTASVQRITILTGMDHPHLVAFGTDSAVLLVDTPTPAGVIGVVVRFGVGTASLLLVEPVDSAGQSSIFTASLSGQGRLLLSDGAELRFAEIRRSAVLN